MTASEQVTETSPQDPSHALDGPIISTFFRYLIPSLVGILSMTSANIVDGIFIGNFVGITALAAVNLIIPIMSLLFAVGLMLSIGGSVRGGKYLGEKNFMAASAIFSKTLIAVTAYGIFAITLGLIFEETLFSALGAGAELFPLMSEYYRIIMPFLIPQLMVIALYFFIRLDGYPALTAAALVFGAALNIGLDFLFVGIYKWGLEGAAYATGLSQLMPLLILMSYFLSKKRQLKFSLKQQNWREISQAAYNGVSEFINEISAGVITLIFNWMLIKRAGIEGVAAITAVNYLLMVGFMVFFSVGDTNQVMVSQNFGARNTLRIKQFVSIAGAITATVSLLCILALTTQGEFLVLMFFEDETSESSLALALQFIDYIWPAFLFVGANMLISSYLTAVHLPFQSGVVALSRSLVLPASCLILFYYLFSDYRFVTAVPVAEAITLIIATAFFMKHRPSREVQAS